MNNSLLPHQLLIVLFSVGLVLVAWRLYVHWKRRQVLNEQLRVDEARSRLKALVEENEDWDYEYVKRENSRRLVQDVESALGVLNVKATSTGRLPSANNSQANTPKQSAPISAGQTGGFYPVDVGHSSGELNVVGTRQGVGKSLYFTSGSETELPVLTNAVDNWSADTSVSSCDTASSSCSD